MAVVAPGVNAVWSQRRRKISPNETTTIITTITTTTTIITTTTITTTGEPVVAGPAQATGATMPDTPGRINASITVCTIAASSSVALVSLEQNVRLL